MTATTAPVTRTTVETTAAPMWRTAARAGVVAAVATTALAAAALGADVPLEIDGEQIPLAGFAQLTALGATLGLGLAAAFRRWASRPRRSFTTATVVLTALSIVPDLAITATTATRVVLIATHVVAAAIVIPAVAARLAETRTP